MYISLATRQSQHNLQEAALWAAGCFVALVASAGAAAVPPTEVMFENVLAISPSFLDNEIFRKWCNVQDEDLDVRFGAYRTCPVFDFLPRSRCLKWVQQ